MAAKQKKLPQDAPVPPANELNNVDHVLPEVEEMLPIWGVIRDCVDGQTKVKAKGTVYLPMPNPGDTSTTNRARYDAYKKRGVFVNFTARTLNGMVGTAFSKPPVATLPAALDVMHNNIDGGSVSMDQQAKQVLSDALSVGRCGLLPDYPAVEGFVSQAMVNSGEVRPVIQYYFAENIINWRYTTVNSLRMLSLVVLAEKYDESDDGFKRTQADQYRVLRLEDMGSGRRVYTQEVVRKVNNAMVSQGKVIPLASGRKPFEYIPFEFVGSRNNDGGIDEAPLIGIAHLNIAHYLNSCDFEEMVHVLGQPTTVIAGLTEAWAKDVLGGEVVVGSTVALMLPEGATAAYLQVNESQLAMKAMEHKEAQVVAIGGKLVNQATVQRTAKEAGMDDASEQSILLSAVNNVNAAYRRALETCCLYAGTAVTKDLGYELNTDFEILALDSASIAARVKMWTDGAITWTECRSILRRAGIATETDEKAKAELEEEALANNAAMGLGPDGQPIAGPGAPGEEEDA